MNPLPNMLVCEWNDFGPLVVRLNSATAAVAHKRGGSLESGEMSSILGYLSF